jgi:prepilin-type N-terminal cleavage/methylation domain-containing protein
MNTRPGVTLVEVLVAIFIMGVGMLAILVLFPLGALKMAQSLKDDRCAQAAAQAAALANANNWRSDFNVTGELGFGRPVYVDPVGRDYIGFPSSTFPPPAKDVITGTTIKRRSLSFLTSSLFSARAVPGQATLTPGQWSLRWFSLHDDLTFDGNGVAATPAGNVQREGRYTYALMLRPFHLNNATTSPQQGITDMDIVVYSGRNLQVPGGETTYDQPNVTHSLTADPTKVVIDWSGKEKPPLRRGGWILDTSPRITTGAGAEPTTLGEIHSFFYRVVATEDISATQVQLELQTTPVAQIRRLVVMEGVAEVFPRKTGWRAPFSSFLIAD